MTTVRIWFEKVNEAAYISLLDLQRVMHRSLKRSGLPVWYTLGFNPHIYLTFACPLALGQESLCESCEVKTELEPEQIDFDAWKAALVPVMPSGLNVIRVAPVRVKAGEIAQAEYEIELPMAAAAALERYNALEAAPVEKKTKRGKKNIDLKAFLPALEYAAEGGRLRAVVRLPAGDELNVSPALLLEFLKQQGGLELWECTILRRKLIQKNGEDFA